MEVIVLGHIFITIANKAKVHMIVTVPSAGHQLRAIPNLR